MTDLTDTIVACATPNGPGVRAILRLAGPRSLAIASSIFQFDQSFDPTIRRVWSGSVQLPDIPPIPASLYLWPAPRSSTGQAMAEIHTISSPPLIELILAAMLNAGARAAGPGEFTMRAFLAGKCDLPRAEAVHAVISASTRTDLKQALSQLAGGMTRPLDGLRDDLLSLLADVEAALDFSEEDLQFVAREDLLIRLAKGLAQLTTVQRQITQRSTGERLFRAVLTGSPNVGKSSLFNALGGTALVSPIPGTTRDWLRVELSIRGQTVELVDTAGRTEDTLTDAIDQRAQELGAAQIHDADLILHCIRATETTPPGTERVNSYLGVEVLRVATHCDLGPAPEGMLATSAITGYGIDELIREIGQRIHDRQQGATSPSLSRCRHHVAACLEHLRRAHACVLFEDPAEILALELRGALDQLGEMTGTIHTTDLLDRIFSRFCIGK